MTWHNLVSLCRYNVQHRYMEPDTKINKCFVMFLFGFPFGGRGGYYHQSESHTHQYAIPNCYSLKLLDYTCECNWPEQGEGYCHAKKLLFEIAWKRYVDELSIYMHAYIDVGGFFGLSFIQVKHHVTFDLLMTTCHLMIVCFSFCRMPLSLVKRMVWYRWLPWQFGRIPRTPGLTMSSVPLYTSRSSTNNWGQKYRKV